MAVYGVLLLHTTPDKFYIEACEDETSEVLEIDRLSAEILLGVQKNIPPSAISRPICAVMGTIALEAGMYLVVVSKKKKVGEIAGHVVWKAVEFDTLPFAKTMLHLTDIQAQDNKTLLAMLHAMVATDGFYFSCSYDLTHTVQRLANTSPDFHEMSLVERADQRFVWNTHLLSDIATQPELHRFAMPMIFGFASIKQCIINGKSFDWILISRRSCYRAGVRYYVRGIDQEGHAANYVETEQIIQYNGTKASFVQTRGSMPFFWSQRPDLKYKPWPQISSSLNHLDGFQRHFDGQIVTYGKQIIINLVDHKGLEKGLEELFRTLTNRLDNDRIRYESFDFHKECSKMRWDRLKIIIDRVAPEQDAMGYCLLDSEGQMLQQQEGIFRTNCIDCLDRTNVVQSLLARRMLQAQLQRLGVLHAGQHTEDHLEFEFIYKNVWADNADACAKQYAGTGALKTDYTRKGRRTKWGLLMDGWNSLIRYYKNNFSDGFRQDSIDLFLGNFVVEETGRGLDPLHEQKDWKFMTLPIVMLVAFSMCIVCCLTAARGLLHQVQLWRNGFGDAGVRGVLGKCECCDRCGNPVQRA